PSSPHNQLIGVFSHELARLYNYVYQNEKIPYAIIHSNDGYDEISLTSPFHIITRQSERFVIPEELGLAYVEKDDIYGGKTITDSADIFLNVLKGKGTPAQHSVVIANSAAALNVLYPQKDLKQCVSIANETIISGKAEDAFKKFISLN
ncbi:MAG TPA: anthranilate phosphoribosyltransferase, partial [Bacteroidales bacterium]|nr:anthranilate phosphoribosyltransferase [Bacteroidales bacterium]